jgi:hypothetical protein
MATQASVKWLTEIELISRLFSGRYQTGTYFFEWPRGEQMVRDPMRQSSIEKVLCET